MKWLSVEAASAPKVEVSGDKENSEAAEENEDSEEDDKEKRRKKKRVGFRDRKISREFCEFCTAATKFDRY